MRTCMGKSWMIGKPINRCRLTRKRCENPHQTTNSAIVGFVAQLTNRALLKAVHGEPPSARMIGRCTHSEVLDVLCSAFQRSRASLGVRFATRIAL